MIAIVYNLLSLIAATKGIEGYPWGGTTFSDRSQILLEGLRENMGLEVFQDALGKSLLQPGVDQLFMKNLEGNPFSVKVREKVDGSEPKEIVELDDFNRILNNMCFILSDGYWNYEWCHRREVRQFHIQQKKGQYLKTPDWSLGRYQRTVTIREVLENQSREPAPIKKVVDYYIEGQNCDETGLKRSTEVHIQCCEGSNIKGYVTHETYFSHRRIGDHRVPPATLTSINEPETCSYLAVVCSPLLCTKNDLAVAESKKMKFVGPDSPAEATQKLFINILKEINGTCLNKQEEWWSYEVCIGKGVRQMRFNIEQSVLKDGTMVHKQILANQYILGMPPLSIYNNGTELVKSTNYAIKGENEGPSERKLIEKFGMVAPIFKTLNKRSPDFLVLNFVDGTPCDLDNINRSTTMEIYCGKKNRIISILEDITCHYVVKIELMEVCHLPNFTPMKENVTLLEFSPLYEMQAYDESEETNTNNIEVEPSGTQRLSEEELSMVMDEIVSKGESLDEEFNDNYMDEYDQEYEDDLENEKFLDRMIKQINEDVKRSHPQAMKKQETNNNNQNKQSTESTNSIPQSTAENTPTEAILKKNDPEESALGQTVTGNEASKVAQDPIEQSKSFQDPIESNNGVLNPVEPINGAQDPIEQRNGAQDPIESYNGVQPNSGDENHVKPNNDIEADSSHNEQQEQEKRSEEIKNMDTNRQEVEIGLQG